MPGIPGPITDSAINESELGAYAEDDWHVTPWLRFLLGGRVDRIDVAVNNESPVAMDQVSGYNGATQFSPKATMVVSPAKWLDLFANYGRGFHSNDARTLIEGASTTLDRDGDGYEVGRRLARRAGVAMATFRSRPSPSSSTSTSELTIDGDTASTAPSGPTRRYGGEFTARYNFATTSSRTLRSRVTHAQYTDSVDIAAGTVYVALAPVATFSAGAGGRHRFGPVTVFASAQVRSMSDRPATQDTRSRRRASPWSTRSSARGGSTSSSPASCSTSATWPGARASSRCTRGFRSKAPTHPSA